MFKLFVYLFEYFGKLKYLFIDYCKCDLVKFYILKVRELRFGEVMGYVLLYS